MDFVVGLFGAGAVGMILLIIILVSRDAFARRRETQTRVQTLRVLCRCGWQARDGAKFCARCGRKV